MIFGGWDPCGEGGLLKRTDLTVFAPASARDARARQLSPLTAKKTTLGSF